MLDNVLKFQTVLLREDVQTDSVTVDPEEVKFARIEAAPEDEKEESRERALGLIEAPEGDQRRPRSDSEFGEEIEEGLEDEWVTPGSKPEAAAAAPASAPAPAAVEGDGKAKEE